jgi:hypothetical protein
MELQSITAINYATEQLPRLSIYFKQRKEITENLSLDIDTVTKECIMLIQREINYTSEANRVEI